MGIGLKFNTERVLVESLSGTVLVRFTLKIMQTPWAKHNNV